ncbi:MULTISPECIES: GMC family oxidoreductase [unclassified Crossiella]|uniref:GMC family oxidoreductase N-terminal domain-containing protein n=1 Tax=unclassified Crossiella TaxID=2620835 RepID=UPI001FFF9A84|nr:MULTISPECIES: GMC family oxidoreductase [unclassified Crossiella]MCK2237539.1 GMC family oxidoreductase [Crossiella sp. S99.2]MCK2254825.1 GMC family oxidoreductase [Crossiella sp. S99.1]
MSRVWDALVIGTGPGGAVTARALAEAGLRVLAVEEGDWTEPGSVEPFSLEQMRRQYRGGGLTAALGRPSVAYTEGRGVGGGSEVNSGLYHRPSAELLDGWSRDWRIDGLGVPELSAHSDLIEKELSVSTLPWAMPASSQVLARGADALGWRGFEVPRWAICDERGVRRQTMSVTYWPRAIAAGVELRQRTRALRLELSGPRAVAAVLRDVATGRTERVRFEHVFVCAGAIQTPALLQRSGLRRNIGGNLSVHPTVKVTAEFDEPVNDPGDVPVYQVKEFGPALSFGGSASRPSLLALALSENWPAFGPAMRRWQNLFVYYAAIQSAGRGRVLALPGFADPLVSYRLTRGDHELLRSGLARLTHLLLAAGASVLYPSFRGAPVVANPAGIAAAAAAMTPARSSLMTVHLCGTVPMGEDLARCGADSYGRVHGTVNVHVNDASLLPSAPGVNPQGTIMAVAARNAQRFLTGRLD